MLELYNKIATLCENRGIVVTELYRRCDVSRVALSDRKIGRKRSLSSKMLSKLAGYLRLLIDFLLGGGQSEVSDLPELDDRDLVQRLDAPLCDLSDADTALLFDGEPLGADTRGLLLLILKNHWNLLNTSPKHEQRQINGGYKPQLPRAVGRIGLIFY